MGFNIYLIFTAGFGVSVSASVAMAGKVCMSLRQHLAELKSAGQEKLKGIIRWGLASIIINLLWLVSLALRGVVTYPTTAPQHAHMWLIWLACDTVWIVCSNTMVSILSQKDDITDETLHILRPKQVVFVGDGSEEVAKSVFLDNFTESEIKLSLSNEQPIWRRIPASIEELFSWPHPINEVQNRIHAAMNTFIHFPLALLLLNYANWPWYTLIAFSGVFLRFSTAYRFDPQAWLVLYASKLIDPLWSPGAPKRFADSVVDADPKQPRSN